VYNETTMIIYDLLCGQGHEFEGWFDDARDYEEQHREGILKCPACGSSEVRKVPSASHLSLKEKGEGREQGRRRREGLLRRLYDHLEKNYEDVGDRFVEEARKIHYGESERRNIRGAASWREYRALREEGIDAAPLPLPVQPKEKLN